MFIFLLFRIIILYCYAAKFYNGVPGYNIMQNRIHLRVGLAYESWIFWS